MYLMFNNLKLLIYCLSLAYYVIGINDCPTLI